MKYKLLLGILFLLVIAPAFALNDSCSTDSTEYLIYNNSIVVTNGNSQALGIGSLDNSKILTVYVNNYNMSGGSWAGNDYPQFKIYENTNTSFYERIWCRADSGNWAWGDNQANQNGTCAINTFYNVSVRLDYPNDNAYYYLDDIAVWNSSAIAGNSFGSIDFEALVDSTDYDAEIYIWNTADGECPLETSEGFNTTTTYNSEAIGNTTEEFLVRLNMNEGSLVENVPYVQLNYNGTLYNTTETNLSSISAEYNVSIIVPSVTINDTFDFYWNLTWVNETTNITNSSTSTLQQVVYDFILDDCSVASAPTINFTLLDEETGGTVSGTTNSFWTYNYGDLYHNFSTNTSSSHTFCIYPDYVSLNYDIDLEYTAEGYVTRTYYLTDNAINNTTQQINLYLLNDSNSLDFQISLLDDAGDAIKGAFIQIQKYFRDEGVARTVEILKTDSSGRDVAHFNEDSEYQTIAIVDDVVEHSGLPFQPYCPQASVGEKCERVIKLGAETSSLLHQTYDGYTSSLTYDNDTLQFLYAWADTTGSSHTGRLYVIRRGATDEIICNTSTSSASATLTCNVTGNNTGEILAWAYNTHSAESVELFITKLFTTLHETFGTDGLFWGFIVIFALVCLGLATQSLTNTLLFFAIGVTAVKFFGFIFIPYYSLIVLLLVVAVVIWRLQSI